MAIKGEAVKEKLQEYALIAEIIGAVAIVFSLVFVGVQVQQGSIQTEANTEAIRGQVRESMMYADLQIIEFYGQYIPEEERPLSNWDLYYEMTMRTRENYWMQYRNGLLDEDTFNSYTLVFVDIIHSKPEFRDRWENESQNEVVVGFRDEINRRLRVEME